MSIVYLGICWLFGLWLASMTPFGLPTWAAAGAIGSLGAVGALAIRQRPLALLLGCLAMGGWGGARYLTTVAPLPPDHIARYNGVNTVQITGLVIEEPDIRDKLVYLTVETESVLLPDEIIEQPAQGKILLQTARFPVVPYGSRITAVGNLETPPENEDFSYKAYLARQDIHSLIYRPTVEPLQTGQGNPFYHAVYAFKDKLQASVNNLLSDPQAAFLSAIVLGNKSALSPELTKDFQRAGAAHLIAISGFHIAILIGALTLICEAALPRRAALLTIIGGIALYVVMIGASPSAVRAAIMGSVYLTTTRLFGRKIYAPAVLLLTAVLMTAVNPKIFWHVGFQLSFMAVLGLIIYAPPLLSRAQRQINRRLVWEPARKTATAGATILIITIAAQLLTFPLLLWYFEQWSPVSLPVNLLVVPAQPLAMILGGIAALLGAIAPPLGQAFAWTAWPFLSWTIGAVTAFASLPGAALHLPVSAATVALLYVAIAAATGWARWGKKRRRALLAKAGTDWAGKTAVGVSLLGLMIAVAWAVSLPDGNLRVVFLDVGQGDAIFIETPSGRQILVDGGLYPSVLSDQLGRQLPFWDKELDILVATHPDADHVTGLPAVFERYTVDTLITNGAGFGESPLYDALLTAAADTPIHRARAGETIAIEDGVRLEIVHSSPERPFENRNNNSVSIRLVYGDFTLLLTGDAEAEAERAMIQNGRALNAVVFKAGHHGSNTSSADWFLQAVQPQIIVVSAGKKNRYGHPTPEMLQRARDVGATVLRTDELGAIEVITDGRLMWWRAGPK